MITTSKLTFVFVVLFSALMGEVLHVPSVYSSIQVGLDNAEEGDTVYVAPGIYYEQIYWPSYTQGIKLIGSGIETTIIDGNQVSTVIIIPNDPNSMPLDTNTVIKQFTIRNGSSTNGGGIRIVTASPIIENLLISNNYSIHESHARGGGIYISQCSSVLIRNVTIRYNSSISTSGSGGGGVYCNNSSPTFKNVIVTNNICYGSHGEGHGFKFWNSLPTLINVMIDDNGRLADETTSGGGILLCDSDLTMFNVTISNNLADSGGGIDISNSTSHLVDGHFSSIIGNQAKKGAGIYLSNSDTITIRNLIIRNNETTDHWMATGGGFDGNGDGLYNNDKLILDHVEISDNFGIDAGGFHATNSNIDVINCTITQNSSSTYGSNGIKTVWGSNVNIQNSIIWDNEYFQLELGTLFDDIDSLYISHSLVEGGEDGILLEEENVYIDWNIGIIDTNPLFINSNSNNYQLFSSSPCIDAGNPDSPLDPDSTIADMGVYYYDQIVLLLGDVNNDDLINILDIIRLVQIILGDVPTEIELILGDVNNDSNLDIMDLIQIVNIILSE